MYSDIREQVGKWQKQDTAYQKRWDRMSQAQREREVRRNTPKPNAKEATHSLLVHHIVEADKAVSLYWFTECANLRRQLMELAATHYAAAHMFQTASACRRAIAEVAQ